jgi:hypothetical protein
MPLLLTHEQQIHPRFEHRRATPWVVVLLYWL